MASARSCAPALTPLMLLTPQWFLDSPLQGQETKTHDILLCLDMLVLLINMFCLVCFCAGKTQHRNKHRLVWPEGKVPVVIWSLPGRSRSQPMLSTHGLFPGSVQFPQEERLLAVSWIKSQKFRSYRTLGLCDFEAEGFLNGEESSPRRLAQGCSAPGLTSPS